MVPSVGDRPAFPEPWAKGPAPTPREFCARAQRGFLAARRRSHHRSSAAAAPDAPGAPPRLRVSAGAVPDPGAWSTWPDRRSPLANAPDCRTNPVPYGTQRAPNSRPREGQRASGFRTPNGEEIEHAAHDLGFGQVVEIDPAGDVQQLDRHQPAVGAVVEGASRSRRTMWAEAPTPKPGKSIAKASAAGSYSTRRGLTGLSESAGAIEVQHGHDDAHQLRKRLRGCTCRQKRGRDESHLPDRLGRAALAPGFARLSVCGRARSLGQAGTSSAPTETTACRPKRARR
jgi:hypothetical protein